MQIFSGGILNGRAVDIHVDNNGTIVEVASHQHELENLTGQKRYDLSGWLLLPSLVEPHAHLDKAFLADRVVNSTGDLMGAVRGLEALRHSITHEDIVYRATTAAILLSRNGVTHVRTHVDTTVDGALTPLHALLETRDRCRDFINIQVAALVEWPLTGPGSPERRNLARRALDSGADVIGGCPHLDHDPEQSIEFLLELALEYNVPLDLHADENLRPTSRDLELIADLMIDRGISHPVTASHCVSLSAMTSDDISRIADKVAQAGISIIALPQTNLFLQGRDTHTNVPRAITPVHHLLSHGVTVAAGGDNLQDPFNPMGRGDPLETASLMVMAAHCSPEQAMDMVTSSAYSTIHQRPHSISVGERADFIAVRASSVREVIAMGPPDRNVVYGGVVIDESKRNIK